MQPTHNLLAILLHISLITGTPTPLSMRTNTKYTPVLEKFTLAQGVMVNTLDPDYLPLKESTYPIDLNLNDAKGRPRTLHRRRTHVKDIMTTLAPRGKQVCLL
ncbi:hypothetical protein EMCG_05421 [[Emmonsia] crescens]|uniref:Uncharacterized protein n=1 Tax=[Emmonsia] crescens TaxID=73230 RepID=A0A0G2HP24_9EURO|nr:hypothetical protein EMCG_05421 [Emmonsia crescens UAMH 3008]